MALPLSRAEAIAAHRSGQRLKFLFFWGHTPRDRGLVDASCLSQWYPAPFTVEGVRYETAEHWMMAEKARLFADAEALSGVLSSGHPHQAKSWGRKVRGFDEEQWRAHREEIVYRGSLAKFTAHPHLGQFLLGTSRRVLVEASPRDRVWGIGLGAADPRASDPERWRGENLLGFALMRARTGLSGDVTPSS